MPHTDSPRVIRTIVSGFSIVAMSMTSIVSPVLAQEVANPQLETLRALAETARQNAKAAEEARAASAEQTRRQLGALNERLNATAAQNELIVQMMGQILATQAGASAQEIVDAEIAKHDTQATALEETTKALAENAETELEKQLAEKTAQFEDVLSQLPTKEKLREWSEEEIKRVTKEFERVKAEVDQALDNYVEGEIIPTLREKCANMSAYQQRQLVSQARNGADSVSVGNELRRLGCNGAEDLARKLSQARSAEEAQAAFQSSMQSMMMAAMMSGNPYVAAIAAALMLLAALFSDGNGDGDGDGVDDQPGGGPIQGAPNPSGPPATVAGDSPVADQPVEPAPAAPMEPAPAAPVQPAQEDIDTRSKPEIRSAGGDPEVKAHPGVGCQYGFFQGNDTVLSFETPPDQKPNKLFDIDITKVSGSGVYDNFPTSWKDPRIRLISCDFSRPGVLVQFEPGDGSLCLRIQRPNGAESGFELTDTGFGLGANRLCKSE